MSLPIWERGLKQLSDPQGRRGGKVAPYMGAWIETKTERTADGRVRVAPYMGAWIETGNGGRKIKDVTLSLPIWERGLKHFPF